MTAEGTVFNIQHFTIHDGPGIRTEVFLKGCPLHCLWCSNPESLKAEVQPGVYRKKCIGRKNCGACEEACPRTDAGAGGGLAKAGRTASPLRFYRNRLVAIDYTLCNGCMACAEACPSEAVKAWGRRMTADQIMQEVRRDKGYYDRSGGGITVSGGEPLLQTELTAELFRQCREEGIHTCCETCLCIPWERVEELLPLTDLWIADLKMMDPEKHRAFTGAGNERILENLQKLAGNPETELILRIPVIPGVNDNMENMRQTADFILGEMQGNVRTLQLLSYMRLGMEKYESLGLPYQMTDRLKEAHFRRDYFQRKVRNFADYFNSRGIHTLVGTREKQ